MKKPDSSPNKKVMHCILATVLFIPALAMAKPAPLSIYQKIHNFETILSNAKP